MEAKSEGPGRGSEFLVRLPRVVAGGRTGPVGVEKLTRALGDEVRACRDEGRATM